MSADDELIVLELKLNEPKADVLNLKLLYKGNIFWRTGEEVYLLYKLDLYKYPHSLRPAFLTEFLDSTGKSAEFFTHFFKVWFEMCRAELENLLEFGDFLNFTIKSVKFDKKLLDVNLDGILPINEWIPSTSRLIRSSISKMRNRSPSPHLDFNEDERFEGEKRDALQRMRLLELDNTSNQSQSGISVKSIVSSSINTLLFKRSSSASSSMIFQCEPINEDLNVEVRGYLKEIKGFDYRFHIMKNLVQSMRRMINSMKGCEVSIDEIINTLTDTDEGRDSDDSDSDGETESNNNTERKDLNDVCDQNVIDQFISMNENKFKRPAHKFQKILKHSLEAQLNDIYYLVEELNRRTVLLKKLDAALQERNISIERFEEEKEILRIKTNRTTADPQIDDTRVMAAMNADIEKRLGKVRKYREEWEKYKILISKQLNCWERLVDTDILTKLKELING